MNPIITTWDDPLVAAHGHDLHGPYLRDAWLPVVGPTGAWCLPILDTHRGHPLDVDALAGLLGVKPAVASQTLTRLERYALIRHVGDRLEVRDVLPPLTMRQRRRLPRAHPLHVAEAS